MRRFLAILIALILMVQGTALADTIIFTRNDYEENYDYGWNLAIGQYASDLYVFFRLHDHDVDATGYSVAEDLTQPIVPLSYELDSDFVYNYFPSGNQIGAFYFSGDGYIHIYDVTFDDDKAISYQEITAFDYGNEDMESFYPAMPVICGNYFICASMSESGAFSLYTLDMDAESIGVIDTDGEHALLNVVGICPYNDDSVIIAAQDADLSPIVTFYLYTPEDQELEKAAVISVDKEDISFSTPAYDSENDAVYYIIDDTLYAMTGFDPDSITALPDYQGECLGMLNGQAFLSSDGYYVVSDGTTICAASINPDAANAPAQDKLSIFGDEWDEVYDAIHAYGRANGGAEVKYITERPEGSDISADIIAQSGAIDLYMLNTNSSEYAALASRGYLLPIESEKIQRFVDRMYPQMRDGITRDGQALALPFSFGAYSLGYNPEVFKALGLTEDDVPETWTEFLALLQRMPSLTKDTDYSVFEAYALDSTMRNYFSYAMIQDFCQRYVAGEETDAPALCALLAELDKIDFYNMGLSSDRENRLEDDYEKTVFLRSMDISLYRDDGYFEPMPLVLQEGTEGAIDAEMTVVILNPYSANKEAAIGFLETLLDYVPATVQASVCADWEGGVKMDGADENLQSDEDQIAMIQAELDAATDEDEIAQYQTLLDDAVASKEWLMARFYWEVSPELLAEYQARAGSIHIVQYVGLDFSGLIGPIIDKHLDGGSTADAMIEDIVGKLNIAMNE